MNTKLINSLRTIIREQCANHFDGYCIIRDRRCMYFDAADKLPRCCYLEQTVLPYEPNNAVRVLYYAEIDANNSNRELTAKQTVSIIQAASKQIECEKCGRHFKPASNRQMYCEKCGKIIRREQGKTRKQRQRKIRA